jgi:SAM-dependent methyltransferase
LTLSACLPPQASLTVIEPSPTLCAAARRALTASARHPARAQILTAPLTALPLPDASQDLAWVHHLNLRAPADAAATFSEARRILRPGGRLCVLTPAHIYLGRLPPDRILDLSTARARLMPHPAEADRAEADLHADLHAALPTWRRLLAAGFLTPRLIPLCAARSGPFSTTDAQTLRGALPPLGLEDPDEDPSASAFHPASPFYLLDQPHTLLIHQDWLICADTPC